MNKLTFIAITTLSVVLAGCQKTNLKSAPQPSQAPANFNVAPPINPGVPAPPVQVPPPRFPEGEPLDPVVTPPPQPPVVVMPPPPPIRTGEPEPRDPPRVTPPVTTPPVSTPTVPPVLTPTVRPVPVTPPPVANNPPVTRPPVTTPSNPPPTTQPPPVRVAENPPVTRPPVTQPPVSQPPVTQPPVTVPPTGNPPGNPPVGRPSLPPTGGGQPLPTPIGKTPLLTQPPTGQPGTPITTTLPPPRPPGLTDLPSAQTPATPANPIVPAPATPVPAPVPTGKKEVLPPTEKTVLAPLPPPRPKYDPVDGQCHIEPVTIPPKLEKNELDILFVVDTSASIRKGANNTKEGGELAKLASEMENFAANIKEGTDFRIGVMLAHGPKSPHFAKLFQDGDYPVLRSSDFKKNRKKMWDLLKAKMLKVPDDRWNPHQGEASLMNIYAAIASEKNRSAIINAGLFRKDANLAIIVVTDENDVCYKGYPQPLTSYTSVDEAAYRAGLAPVLKPYATGKKGSVLSPDRLEIEAQKLCSIKLTDKKSGAQNSFEVTPESVAQKLNQLTTYVISGKVIMTGIYYKDNLNAAMKARTDNEDENEMAHGIIDLVKLMGDTTAGDLAEVRKGNGDGDGPSFASTLSLLGKTTNFQMKHDTNFVCRSGLIDGKGFHASAIDLSTVEMSIIQSNDAELNGFNKEKPNLGDFGSTIAKFSASCPAKGGCQHGNGGLKVTRGAGNTIRVSPSDPAVYEKLMKEHGVDTAKYKITFKTKLGVNPQTGESEGAAFKADNLPAVEPEEGSAVGAGGSAGARGSAAPARPASGNGVGKLVVGKPGPSSAVKPAAKAGSATKPVEALRPPGNIPSTKPAGVKPAVVPATRVAPTPSTQPAVTPKAQPATKPASQPAVKPSSEKAPAGKPLQINPGNKTPIPVVDPASVTKAKPGPTEVTEGPLPAPGSKRGT